MSNDWVHEYDRLFMADPLVIVADLLAPAFAAVAGGDGAVDPVVRPSDRADAQANGALALAKQLGRKPATWLTTSWPLQTSPARRRWTSPARLHQRHLR
jgi:hypothetical protein